MDLKMKEILDLVAQPAFLVRENRICWCNAAARELLLEDGDLFPLLGKNELLFSLWDGEGILQLPVNICGREYHASVHATEDGALFVTNPAATETSAAANAVVNVSAALRKPLQNVMSAAAELFGELDLQEQNDLSEASSRLNQGIYQLLRLCGQLADGGSLLMQRKTLHRENADINAFFSAFVRQAAPLVESLGLKLAFTPLEAPVKAAIDPGLLERALFNLLSNSLSYSPKGSSIQLSLTKQGRILLVCLEDEGEGISEQVVPTLFDRFSKRSIGDARWGLGFGLPMVREIARLHGGDLMVSPNSGRKGTKVTFSLLLEQLPLGLRSRSLTYDYCGGLNHALVELSDVLDAELFDPGKI